MSVNELSEAEHVVLLSLVGLLARADGRVSEAEMHTLEQLRADIDPERFAKARDAAAALDSADAILKAAEGITRPEGRETIYDVLVSMSLPDTIGETEATLLERLADLWDLDSPLEA